MNQSKTLPLSHDAWRCPDHSFGKEIYVLDNERKMKSRLKWIMGHSYSGPPSPRKMLDPSSKEVLDNSFTAGAAVLLKSQHVAGMLENITEKMLKQFASIFPFCFLLIKKMHLSPLSLLFTQLWLGFYKLLLSKSRYISYISLYHKLYHCGIFKTKPFCIAKVKQFNIITTDKVSITKMKYLDALGDQHFVIAFH